MPAGRPSLYTPELLEAARAYVDGAWERYGDAYPQISSIASYIGISRETVHAWVKDVDKVEFSDIISDLMQKQESMLFNRAIIGEFNSTITKLALTKHGYTDKSENTIQGGENPLTIQTPWQVLGVKGS